MRINLTTKQIEDIYDILEECCGAHNIARLEFLGYMANKEGAIHGYEFRFVGWLGFGGKLYSNSQGVYVGCYQRDETPLRVFAIKIANQRIKDLLES